MSKILFHVSHNFESSFLSDRSQYFVTSIFKSQLILLELGCPCKQRVKNFLYINWASNVIAETNIYLSFPLLIS